MVFLHPSLVTDLQLVEEEGVGGYSAPEQQQAGRGGSRGGAPRQLQYDGDAGFSGAGATSYGQAAMHGGRGGGCGAGDAPLHPPVGVGDDSGSGNDVEAQQAEVSGPAGGSGGSPTSATNQQSAQQGGATGRLWEGTSGSAARSDHGASEGRQATRGRLRSPRRGGLPEAGRRAEQSPERRVGEIMRQKIEEEGWQLIVQGHRWVGGRVSRCRCRGFAAAPPQQHICIVQLLVAALPAAAWGLVPRPWFP